MTKEILFDWRVGEQEYELRALPALEDQPRSLTVVLSRSDKRLLRGLVLSWALLILVAGAALSPYQQDRLEAHTAIRAALDAEITAWHEHDQNFYRSLLDDHVITTWSGEWRSGWSADPKIRRAFSTELLSVQAISPAIGFASDSSSAQIFRTSVEVTQPEVDWWRTPTFRETRFYRATPRGWVRTVPPVDLWGEPQTLETGRIRFVYYESDAAAVSAAAQQVDPAIRALTAAFDLTYPEQLVIAVVPEMVHSWAWTENGLKVASPQLSRITDGLSDGDFLARVVLHQILDEMLRVELGMNGNRTMYRWGFFWSAARGWLRHDLMPQPAPWRDDAKEVFQEKLQSRFPLVISDIYDFPGDEKPSPELVMWRHMAAESLLDYIVVAYGYEYVPRFLDNMAAATSWSTLVSYVFGVPLDTFVADWNRYLDEQYRGGEQQAYVSR